ncbi:hypothetical protein [Spiroplasma clarkii]|uniref:Uncharacterized protein n=1 Tax=Spiroplasma clarkii TaxID=2139 RepID=A0A2K8KH56_9MOLU|nr:hypothetical protein [Spiroplasma clarkii]ATX71023.1 hypothetical protein SCLAR_v1c07060 [Spiroplasma clarkii]
MDKDKIKEINTVSEADVMKEMCNNTLSNKDKNQFLESIMENYYLDNDNINFLEDNGYSFFKFQNQDQCFCLSGKVFAECCQTKMQPKRSEPYTSYEKSLLNPDEFKVFQTKMTELFLKHYQNLGAKQVCAIPTCQKQAVESNLYQIDFANEKWYSTNKINPLDSNFKMGEVFFNTVEANNFKYFGWCADHEQTNQKNVLSKESSEIEIIQMHTCAILFKLFIAQVCLTASQEDFLSNFNSIAETGFQAIFVYRLKKLANQVQSLQNILLKYLKSYEKNTDLKVITWELGRQKNFQILDLIYPQISPSDFQVINSVNNVFVAENPISFCVNDVCKNTLVTIVFDKTNKKLQNFINQYLLIIDEKSKAKEYFVSNCALILADNILFSAKYFEKLSLDDKVFLSALNKFRYENPTAGHEYVKMQFFAGFTKGNDFFK